MDIEKFENLLSNKRLETYYNKFNGDKQTAIEFYKLNTEISKLFYPILAYIEIGLRNSIHQSFSVHFKTTNWFNLVKEKELLEQIEIAKIKKKTSKIQTTDNLIAELTFGFWTSLYNKQHAKLFWKPLIYSLPEINKSYKQRDKISFKLNQIRKFRNRIFHYEPIAINIDILNLNFNNCISILKGLDKNIIHDIKEINEINRIIIKLNAIQK